MPLTLPPYISICQCCEQGLLRLAVCKTCRQIVAICDECEAVWKEPSLLKSSTMPRPDAQHPECPHCRESATSWQFLSAEEIESLGMLDLITGYSR